MTKDELIEAGFDSKSLRYIRTWVDIKTLPIKHCTQKELWEAKKGWFYNPIHYYPKYARIQKNEQGYDDKYRYVLDIDSPPNNDIVLMRGFDFSKPRNLKDFVRRFFGIQ